MSVVVPLFRVRKIRQIPFVFAFQAVNIRGSQQVELSEHIRVFSTP